MLLGGCVHEQLSYRDGCWVKRVATRRGDVRESIAACAPTKADLSSDPLVRAVEVCLQSARQARFETSTATAAHASAAATDWEAVVARCLSEPQRLALDQVERMRVEREAALNEAKRMADENRELRQSMIACVEKTPNAMATANASTESKSDSTGHPGSTVEVIHTVSPAPRRPLATPAKASVAKLPAVPADCPKVESKAETVKGKM